MGNGLEAVRKGSGRPIRSPQPLSRMKEVMFCDDFIKHSLQENWVVSGRLQLSFYFTEEKRDIQWSKNG